MNIYLSLPCANEDLHILISNQFNLLIMKNLKTAQPQAQPKAQPQAQPKAQPKAETKAETKAENINDLLQAINENQKALTLLFSAESVKPEKVKTERQILNGFLDTDVRGLGTWFSAITSRPDQVIKFLNDQKAKGKKIDPVKVSRMLYGNPETGKKDFNLFRQYRNEKETTKETFTANQVTGIFLRACLVD